MSILSVFSPHRLVLSRWPLYRSHQQQNHDTAVTGWLPVDLTFGQVRVDATHIKFLDGDHLADLLPRVDIVGKIRLQILSFRSS